MVALTHIWPGSTSQSADHNLRRADLIAPIFVCEEENVCQPIPSIPGCSRLSLAFALEEAAKLFEAGVGAVIPYALPKVRDACGTSLTRPDSFLQRMLSAMKEQLPKLTLISDVCICQGSDHGHCGIINEHEIAQEETLRVLSELAVACAHSGADMLMLSSMTDGIVMRTRQALEAARLHNVMLISQSAKQDSGFYVPFRAAAHAQASFNKSSYQVAACNRAESLRECFADEEEGVDMIMLKPALTSLDVLSDLAQTSHLPLATYCTSGEHALILAGAQAGLLKAEDAFFESFLALKRAGASCIATYAAQRMLASGLIST